jgi:hypothetical protein
MNNNRKVIRNCRTYNMYTWGSDTAAGVFLWSLFLTRRLGYITLTFTPSGGSESSLRQLINYRSNLER